jgi:hypothetical protein
MDGQGWDAHVVCSPGMVWDGVGGVPKAWSDAGFRTLERDALLAVMGVTGGATLQGAVPELMGLPLGQGLWPVAEGRLGAIFVHPARRRVRPTGHEAPGALVIADRDLPRPVPGSSSEPAALLGQWCATVGVESAGSDGSEVEGLAARLATALQVGQMPESGVLPGDGLSSGPGFHCLPLDERFPIHESLIARLTRLVGEDPQLCWGQGRGAPVAASKSGKGPEFHPAWGTVSLSPSGQDMASPDAGALSATIGGTSRARLSIGMVRPSALASVLGRDDHLVPPWAKRLDQVRWEAWLRDDGMVESTVSVRMAR